MDSTLKVQRYAPGQIPVGDDLPQAMVQVYHELSEISGVLGNLVEGRQAINYNEPTKKRPGQLAYADGTKWNPGDGQGLYVYTIAGVWRRLEWNETASFTPSLKFGGAAVGLTGSQAGTYVRVGHQVDFSFRCQLTNKGASVGIATVDGFPYNAVAFGEANQLYAAGMGAANTGTSGYVLNATFTMLMLAGGNTVNMTDADFTNGSDIIYSGSYQA